MSTDADYALELQALNNVANRQQAYEKLRLERERTVLQLQQELASVGSLTTHLERLEAQLKELQ